MIKVISIIVILTMVITCFVGCSAADNVNHNLSVSANKFEVLRRITVYNARTDLIVMEMEGYMSLSNNTTNELVVTCKVGENQYKKNYVYLNEYVIYVVEDIAGAYTDPYHYNVHFYVPKLDVEIN